MSEPTVEETTDAPNALCAFTVVVDGDGVPRIFGQGIEGVRPFRDPTALDIRRALLELVSDYNAQAAAQYVADELKKAGVFPAEEPSVSERVSAALAASVESD